MASRGAGAIALAALVSTLVLVFIANQLAFTDGSVVSARIALVALLVAAVVFFLGRPFKKLRSKGVADELERSVPAFDGRVETFLDQTRRNDSAGQQASPLLNL